MPLTAEQRRAFQQHGWFHLGRIFSEPELEEIRAAYDRALSRPLRLAEDGRTPFDYSPLLHLQSETLARYATAPPIVETAIELLGPDVRLYWDQAVAKPAGASSEVPWHQDNGYTPVEPAEYVTFTVALDATSEENGCLWIQPGSHRRGVVPHQRAGLVFYRGYDGPETGVAVPQPPGDVLAFSSLTMHRTGPNRSSGPRRSWVIQFCHGDARHAETGVLFDDRLLVARGGRRLDPPLRERPFDLRAVIEAGAARG